MSAPSTEVGPGFLAFVVFFFLAIALWLLMRNMFTRVRRMSLAERAEEKRRQEMDRDRQPGPTPTDDRPAGEKDSGVGDGPEEGQGRGDEV